MNGILYTQNARLSTSSQKVVIIDHFWVVTLTVPFLTTLRQSLGQKAITVITLPDNFGNQMVPKLGYRRNNFLLVNADNFFGADLLLYVGLPRF